MAGRYFDLVVYRALAELRAETERAYLGFLWWVLEPILYMAVFYVVFGLGLRHADEGFVAFLLCGLLPWKWLDSTVRTSSGVIAMSVGLMGQVYIPKITLPMVIMLSNTIKFMIVLALYLGFLAWYGHCSPYTWFWLPVLVLIQLLLIFVMASFAAAIVPIIPDLKHVINNGMTLLFFMSGIFFKIEMLEPTVAYWLGFNPALVMIDQYRRVLLYGLAPDWGALSILCLCLLIFMLLVFQLFRKLDRYYPRVIG